VCVQLSVLIACVCAAECIDSMCVQLSVLIACVCAAECIVCAAECIVCAAECIDSMDAGASSTSTPLSVSRYHCCGVLVTM